MANKMTKKDYFNELLTIEKVVENENLVKFINHELELLAKKNSKGGEKKLTAVQIANNKLKESILNSIEHDKKYTITELIKAVPELDGLTNQKISAIANQMVVEGMIEKTIEKRKSYFSLM